MYGAAIEFSIILSLVPVDTFFHFQSYLLLLNFCFCLETCSQPLCKLQVVENSK